jgi:hypothetical protein
MTAVSLVRPVGPVAPDLKRHSRTLGHPAMLSQGGAGLVGRAW